MKIIGGSKLVFTNKEQKSVSLHEFTIKKMLGKGMFGRTFLVVHKYGLETVYAMKSYNKDMLDELSPQWKLEVDIMSSERYEKEEGEMPEHLFGVLNFDWIFESEERVYYFTKHCPMGDLFK